ncbi:aminopeptidase P family protein [Microcoleus sp. FACHB-831]|nr:aminopeptidase P family protein [Microcoleus sp. FACHB-831]
MYFPSVPANLAKTLRDRRSRLAALVDFPVILWSGRSTPRNYPANTFPFRASSHFLYFAGIPLEYAAIRLEAGSLELFMDDASPASALWHGEMPKRSEIAQLIGADAAFPLAKLASRAARAATLAVQDASTYLQQCEVLNRLVSLASSPLGIDLELVRAIISLRLTHDADALTEVRQAAACTVAAHKAGMAATPGAKTEADIRAAMEAVIISRNMTCAYPSIVSVHGEVLHNEQYHHQLQPGDLLLADVGAESHMGWASDVTRTWPVSGTFSPTQRDIYNVVLAAHDACIDKIHAGVEYRDIHLLACKVIAEGLVDLGILRGDPEYLVEIDAHALFFPHGVGHLLGLDVHDMEDLGDLAGYEEGRARSDRFGLNYLRLNRVLQPGMLVTIEPGFYQVPAILNNSDRRLKFQDVVNWERLAQFADVRGIRIEDDVLVTETGSEILTAALPTQANDIEQLIQGERTSNVGWTAGKFGLKSQPRGGYMKRCREIFEKIRPQLIEERSGWFVAIEGYSGDYFVDADKAVAKQKARQKYPEGRPVIFQLKSVEQEAKEKAEYEVGDQRGREIFEQIRDELIKTHYNCIVIVEPESGDYFIGSKESVALKNAREKHPHSRLYVFCLN